MINDDQYAYIKEKVFDLTRIDLDCYKEQQMRRRFNGLLERVGAPDAGAYFSRVEQDQKMLGELRDFLTGEHAPGTYEALLEEADKKMIRVLDDLIEVLIRKNVILLTDLPREAREKLGTRQSVRSRLQELGTDLTVDDIL